MMKGQIVFPKEILNADYFREINVLNLLPIAVYVCDLSGEIVSYNQKAVELWGRTPKKGDKNECFCGAFKRYYPDGRYIRHSESPSAKCLEDGLLREDVEIIIERPNISRIVVSVTVVPIRNGAGDLMGVVNCFHDITGQKEIQKALEKKTVELEDYVENASIGLHWVDENGIILWANKAELDMLGYSTEEYIGHHISEFHVDQDKIRDILGRLSCKETLRGYESTLQCRDGSTRIVHISSNVLWEDGKFIHTRCFTVDVTEQRKLHNALVKSESLYRDLVSAIPAGVYTCDCSGRITFFNEAAVALWGYRPNLNDDSLRFCACYKVWTMDGIYICPEETPMAIALRTGQNFRNTEALVERPDGSKFYANVNIGPLYDGNNNLAGAINVFQDITAIKEATIAIRESEGRYSKLIQTLDTPLYTTDAEGRITLYNKAAAALWGREPEIGRDLWCGSYKIFNPDGSDLPLDICPMAVCLKEQRPVLGEEIVVVRPDGTLRNVAPHPQPLFDGVGRLIGAVNMLVDITGMKEAERRIIESEQNYKNLAATLEAKVKESIGDLLDKNEQLRQSEERYHKMIDEVEDYAIILLDREGFVLNWNKGAEKIKGYKEEEILGRNFEVFYLPEDRATGVPQKIIKEAIVKGKAMVEGWRLKSDGGTFWGSIVITALHTDTGEVIGFTKVTRDLTERKLAEDKLKEYSSELEFRNKELEQFAYAASHDMKEPLRKINLYGAYIRDNQQNKLDSRSKEYLERSLNAAKRMGKLIEDLLAYSRTTSSLDSYKKADMNEIVKEVVSEYKEEIIQKSISVFIEEMPIVMGIPFQLKQLMFNLIGNAIKYSDPSKQQSVKITASSVTASKVGASLLSTDKPYYRISIEDNGVGFEQGYSEKIFEMFQRLENVESTKGTGIGLTICKKIVQNHKGFIVATGKLNEGAVFDVYLPKHG